MDRNFYLRLKNGKAINEDPAEAAEGNEEAPLEGNEDIASEGVITTAEVVGVGEKTIASPI